MFEAVSGLIDLVLRLGFAAAFIIPGILVLRRDAAGWKKTLAAIFLIALPAFWLVGVAVMSLEEQETVATDSQSDSAEKVSETESTAILPDHCFIELDDGDGTRFPSFCVDRITWNESLGWSEEVYQDFVTYCIATDVASSFGQFDCSSIIGSSLQFQFGCRANLTIPFLDAMKEDWGKFRSVLRDAIRAGLCEDDLSDVPYP